VFKFCGGPCDGEQRLMDLAPNEQVTVKAFDWSWHEYRFDRPNWGLSYVGRSPEKNVERRGENRERRVGQPDRRADRSERRLAKRDRRAA
jgi:hypothetical protein